MPKPQDSPNPPGFPLHHCGVTPFPARTVYMPKLPIGHMHTYTHKLFVMFYVYCLTL